MGTPAPNSVWIKGVTNAPAKIVHPNVAHTYGAGVNAIASTSADQLLAAEKLGRTGWMIKAVKANSGSVWIGIGRGPQVGRDIEVVPGELFVMPAHLVTQDELRIRGTVGDKYFFLEA